MTEVYFEKRQRFTASAGQNFLLQSVVLAETGYLDLIYTSQHEEPFIHLG